MRTRIQIVAPLIIAAILLACLPGNLGEAGAPTQPTVAPREASAPSQSVSLTGGIIVDNASPGFSIQAGEWGVCRGSDCQGVPYGADFRYADAKCLTCRARFELTVVNAGSYELYAWWPNGADRATDTPFTITYRGGSNTLQVDQRNSGDDWFWLQTLDLQAGESVTVVIGGAASGFANADAIALMPTGSAPSAAAQPTQGALAQPTTRPVQPTTQPLVQPTARPIVGGLNPNPPTKPMRLIFIHHSTGEAWLADGHGGLGRALRDNNYFVSDTNYDWGPDSIGSNTDIGHWWTWFRGSNSSNYLRALYAESEQHAEYSRLGANPGGENQIVMFKSCFPNSYLHGNPNDPPTPGNNPLRGQEAGEHLTVANAKGIYNDILQYFATRQDKLFVVVTAPPQAQNETDAAAAANARAFNNWLLRDWLKNYPHKNVFVFDFYNVLTSNAGNANANDAERETGNHHRLWKGAVQHVQGTNNNFAAYPSARDDSHPTAAGDRKATAEFVPLLNVAVHCWLGDGACMR